MEAHSDMLTDRDKQTNALVPLVQVYEEALPRKDIYGNFLYVRDKQTNALVPLVKLYNSLTIPDIADLQDTLVMLGEKLTDEIRRAETEEQKIRGELADLIRYAFISVFVCAENAYAVLSTDNGIGQSDKTRLADAYNLLKTAADNLSNAADSGQLSDVKEKMREFNTRLSDYKKTEETVRLNIIANIVNSTGVNLLKNSSFENNGESWTNQYLPVFTKEQSVNNNYSIKYASSGASANRNLRVQQNISVSALEKGSMYTYSFYIYTPDVSQIDQGIEFGLVLTKESGTDYNMVNYTLESGNWIRITKTFTVATDIKSAYFRLQLVRNGIVYYSSPKLERGIASTAWTPHPDDATARMNTLEARIAALENK